MANRVTGKLWNGVSDSNKATLLLYQDYRLNVQKKSKQTVKNESNTLRKLARFHGKQDFKNITEQEIQSFFGNSDIVQSNRSRDLYGAHIIKFYNWLLKLKRKRRPPFMDWFEYQNEAQRQKEIDPNKKEKQFITRDEYDLLIKWTADTQEKALWEALYLSGARPSEICSMRIDSVRELENGYEITAYDSKTRPRNIPLSEHPEHLLRWVRNHPYRNRMKHPLWLSQSNRKQNNPMVADAINFKLKKAIKRTGIKTTLTPHCFRRTRATIMFTQKSKDGGLIYTDKEISLHFGWQIGSVPLRRAEYDLTDQEDLRKKVFGSVEKAPSYEVIKVQKEKYEKKINEIDKVNIHLSNRLKELEHKMDDMVHNREQGLEKAERTDITHKEYTKEYAKANPKEYQKLIKQVKLLNEKLGITTVS
ncbi:MAG: tyrosine-type recombinase/integrase [Thermoplasmatales archaeon]|nr:tyrosine-type recombinase/integrase [Thermoplasmatales archaeon]